MSFYDQLIRKKPTTHYTYSKSTLATSRWESKTLMKLRIDLVAAVGLEPTTYGL